MWKMIMIHNNHHGIVSVRVWKSGAEGGRNSKECKVKKCDVWWLYSFIA